MLFSEYFNIMRRDDDDWFDPIMHKDTKLFIDPFLIFKFENEFDEFIDSHKFMMDFFNSVFVLIAETGGNDKSPGYGKAIRLLSFHEVNEICLGYSPIRRGAGTGKGSAVLMASNIWNCIVNGIVRIEHLEELGIFGVGIGRDKISDITANLLKDKLVKYTQSKCVEYKIPMEKVRLKNGCLDMQFLRWENTVEELPINPFKGKGVLLVPNKFLRELQEINKDDFWLSVRENEELRNDLNYEVDKNLDKAQIAKIALKYPYLVREYINEVESREGKAYNLEADNKLIYKWYEKASEIVRNNPIDRIDVNNEDDFVFFINNLASIFKHYVEEQSGYKLLWDNDYKKNKSEEAVQLLFLGIVEHYCNAFDIDVSKEVNQGRGPVDFKFSSGYRRKVLLEAKLANNTKFWNGIEKQLPKYLSVESSKHGIFMVLIFRKNDFEKVKGIQNVISEVNKNNDLNIEAVVINALPKKPSASNL